MGWGCLPFLGAIGLPQHAPEQPVHGAADLALVAASRLDAGLVRVSYHSLDIPASRRHFAAWGEVFTCFVGSTCEVRGHVGFIWEVFNRKV